MLTFRSYHQWHFNYISLYEWITNWHAIRNRINITDLRHIFPAHILITHVWLLSLTCLLVAIKIVSNKNTVKCRYVTVAYNKRIHNTQRLQRYAADFFIIYLISQTGGSLMTSSNGNIFRVTGPLWWSETPSCSLWRHCNVTGSSWSVFLENI